MKTLSRKVSTLVVVMLALALLLLAACGGTDEPTNNSEVTPPAPAATTPDTPTPAAVVTEDQPTEVIVAGVHAPKDMGGRTLTAAMWWDGGVAYSMAGPGYSEPDPSTSTNYFIDRLIWDNARRVEREFNVNFEGVNIPGAMEVIPVLTASVMAGDPMADLVFMEPWMMLSAIHGDLIVPLDTINLPGSDLLGPRVYTSVRAEGLGHLWAFWTSALNAGGVAMGVNLDIINAIGARNPVDLYHQGQWNWEAMLEIMRMSTRDTTGDGVNDQWGISGQPGEILRNLIGSNDGMLATDDLIYAFDHPNTMQALEFMETIIQEGLWYSDPSQDIDPGDWGRNFWAYELGVATFFPTATWAISDNRPTYEFAVVPFPTGPANTTGATWLGGWRQGYAIAAGSDWAPADVLMLVEELFSWAGDEPDLMNEGALDSVRGAFLTEQDAMVQLDASRTMRSDMGYNVPEYPWQLDRFIRAFFANEMTAAQAVEAYRGPLQEMLDAFR
jgi:multiple sugar transport system substrate-binding protein